MVADGPFTLGRCGSLGITPPCRGSARYRRGRWALPADAGPLVTRLRDRSDQDRHSDTFRLVGVTLHHSPPRRDCATHAVPIEDATIEASRKRLRTDSSTSVVWKKTRKRSPPPQIGVI